MVTSQSPVTLVCAKAGAAVVTSRSAKTRHSNRFIGENSRKSILRSSAVRAVGAEGSFAHRAEARRAGDAVAFHRAGQRDVERLAVFHFRPRDLHLVAVDGAAHRLLAVLRAQVAGEPRPFVREVQLVLDG